MKFGTVETCQHGQADIGADCTIGIIWALDLNCVHVREGGGRGSHLRIGEKQMHIQAAQWARTKLLMFHVMSRIALEVKLWESMGT